MAYRDSYQGDLSEIEYIVLKSAQWGADKELKACCTVLDGLAYEEAIGSDRLREARRPKPPSLKECALNALEHILRHSQTDHGANTIRHALEQLND